MSELNGPETAPIVVALAALADGRMVVVVDAADRESDGNVVMAAEKATAEDVNFMATYGRGLVCIAMPREDLDRLRIPPMVARSDDPDGTRFHVSVDLRERTSSGVSARDRAATFRALADPRAVPDDFRRPGHLFSIARQSGGVLRRATRVEASVDLVELAGLRAAAAMCGIAGSDGEPAGLPELVRFAGQHGLPVVTVADLVTYRHRREPLVERVVDAGLPLLQGTFRAIGYRDLVDGREHVAVVLGDVTVGAPVTVHVHSECLVGDVFGSRRCDCGRELDEALACIGAHGRGVVVYLRDLEGRGGQMLKKLQTSGLGPGGTQKGEVGFALSHRIEERDLAVAARILDDLGVGRIHLLSSNPTNATALTRLGISLAKQAPVSDEPVDGKVARLRGGTTATGDLAAVPGPSAVC